MKTSIHRGSWLVTLPVAGLAVAYVLGWYVPGRRQIEQLSEELAADEEFVALADAVAPAIQTTRHQLQECLAYNAAWTESAPAQAELSALFGKIHALARASGSTTIRFDPEPPVVLDKLRRIPVVLGCTGSFAQIAEFLHHLEALPQAIWIEGLKIEQSRQDRESVECQLELLIFADNPDDSDQVDLTG